MGFLHSPRPPHHGFHLTCKTCAGSKYRIGGIENPKQFSDILQDYKKQHLNHDYELKQSYHAAELGNAYHEETTTRRTVTGRTFSDFTNNTMASTNFTAGKKYLISITAQID
jgi:hypothetical protein